MKPKTNIKNILFDLGNTLVYFDFNYFYEGVSSLEKRLNPIKFGKYIKENKMVDKLCLGRMNHKDFFRHLKKKFSLKIGYNDFINLYVDIFWTNTNMKNFLEKISKTNKFKLFMLSNVDSEHIKFIDKNFPFVKILKNRVLSYKVKSIKPQKKIFSLTLKKFGIKACETVLIDDMMPNVRAASGLGIKTIRYSLHREFIKKFTKLVKQEIRK